MRKGCGFTWPAIARKGRRSKGLQFATGSQDRLCTGIRSTIALWLRLHVSGKTFQNPGICGVQRFNTATRTRSFMAIWTSCWRRASGAMPTRPKIYRGQLSSLPQPCESYVWLVRVLPLHLQEICSAKPQAYSQPMLTSPTSLVGHTHAHTHIRRTIAAIHWPETLEFGCPTRSLPSCSWARDEARSNVACGWTLGSRKSTMWSGVHKVKHTANPFKHKKGGMPKRHRRTRWSSIPQSTHGINSILKFPRVPQSWSV